MPGCMLRASGRDFEPDEFAKDSDLSIRESHRKGKPRLNGTLHDDGYIGVLVSDSSGDDIDGQVDDAVAFLRQHQDELKRLVSFPGVEDIRLDFSRLFYSDTQVCQYNFFAPKLIRLMGELGLGIELSTYAVEDSPESNSGDYAEGFDPRETLRSYADDTEVDVRSCDRDQLVLGLKVDSCGGAQWLVTIRGIVHLDLPPSFMLGRVAFGGIELVPGNYFTSRNRGYEGDEDKYHVIKITDQDDNMFLIVSYEEAEIVF